MKKIKLGGKYGVGKFALVDDDDYEELNKFKWCIANGYAVRSIWINGKDRTEWMHRIINKTPDGLQTDHINMDRLDNRKKNLRSCTNQQNQMNRGALKNNSLGIKGVHISTDKRNRKIYKYIRADIKVNGEQIYLGLFKTVEEASKAYAEASIKYHGEFSAVE